MAYRRRGRVRRSMKRRGRRKSFKKSVRPLRIGWRM